MTKYLLILGIILFAIASSALAQDSGDGNISKVWVADLGNGSYKNPVIHADYSDPDVCRVADDFYLVSSSFDAVPGLPILHSRDLINWRIIGHALKRQPPFDHFSKTQHGNGVWAPAIRYYNKEFYIYYPDPDFGIYLTKSSSPSGPWTEPLLVIGGKGLIDPCPLWDDGKVYLAHAFAGSRAGIKSILAIRQLNADGTKSLDEGTLVYDGHVVDPTIEGPKLHKRNGYYYIFAPAGGVATGWQLALRSKNIYGPYERKVVMDQGTTAVNGPHQGAWVDTPSGEDWFLHFQDKDAYGRVVHLQPMKWVNDWPVIGVDKDGDGKGEPVLTFKKPNVGKAYPIQTPAESDEFNDRALGLQWQWQANPKATWAMAGNNGSLRIYSEKTPDSAQNFWDVPNILMQKITAEEFTVTTKMKFSPNEKLENERTGLIVMGQSYASVFLRSRKGGIDLVYALCKGAAQGKPESEKIVAAMKDGEVFLRVSMKKGALCTFSYSIDAKKFVLLEESFKAEPGRWIGTKMGIFCTRVSQINDSGYADFDWFRIEPLVDKL